MIWNEIDLLFFSFLLLEMLRIGCTLKASAPHYSPILFYSSSSLNVLVEPTEEECKRKEEELKCVCTVTAEVKGRGGEGK